jgi:hypothetical protein
METDDALRAQIASMMRAALKTESHNRAYTSAAVNAVVARLQALQPDDLTSKLRIAGFTAEPYISPDDQSAQACATCMYYATHRQFCELPELLLPVKPDWSCRLWRI